MASLGADPNDVVRVVMTPFMIKVTTVVRDDKDKIVIEHDDVATLTRVIQIR